MQPAVGHVLVPSIYATGSWSCASPVHICNWQLVIIVPADGLAPDGARPSAGTMLTALDVSMISMMLYHIRGLDDILKIAMITKYLPAFQVLTLNMLNCFKVYKRYIHIVNPILDLAWTKWMKLMKQQWMSSVLHSQYYACWCSGDFRRQSISRQGIDPKARIIHPQHNKS